MIKLTDDERDYIKKELMPFLKRNDTKGMLKKCMSLSSNIRGEILGFLAENGIPFMTRVQSLPKRIFEDTDIAGITIPGNIKRIPNGAFANCTSLRAVTLEEGVEEIENYAFHKCSSLTSIKLPETMGKLGKHCFAESGLAEIYIPMEITYLEANMFEYCAENLVIYADSRKGLPASRRLTCPHQDVEWLKEHLKVRADRDTIEKEASTEEAAE